MTSQTSSSESDQQREIDELKARILVLEGLVAGLQQWQLRPFLPAGGPGQPPAQVVYPGTYPYTVTIPAPLTICQGAAPPPLTYVYNIP